jgi:hypothetical protein
MRKLIVAVCVLMVVLIPACMVSAPDPGSPAPTAAPGETQVVPSAAAPTGLPGTPELPGETAFPGATVTFTAPPAQIPATLAPTETPLPAIRFYMQPGTPTRLANFVTPEAGCNWLGIAGQVFDLNGNPLTGVVIEVGGSLNGQPVQQLALTGSSPAVGPGGYVIVLEDHPVQSDGTVWFQLLDQGGSPKTGRILLTTSDRCEENLTLINLIEANPVASQVNLPVILKSVP